MNRSLFIQAITFMLGAFILIVLVMLVVNYTGGGSSSSSNSEITDARNSNDDAPEELKPGMKKFVEKVMLPKKRSERLHVAAMKHLWSSHLTGIGSKYVGVRDELVELFNKRIKSEVTFVSSKKLKMNDEGEMTFNGEGAVTVNIQIKWRITENRYEAHLSYYSAGEGSGSGIVIIKIANGKITVIDEDPWEIS